jgi:hypothetical protein
MSLGMSILTHIANGGKPLGPPLKDAERSTSTIYLYDNRDNSSRDAIRSAAGPDGDRAISRVNSNPNWLGAAAKDGNVIVIPLDRVDAEITRASRRDSRYDPNTEAGRAEIIDFLADKLSHEVGHNLGLDDSDDKNSIMKKNSSITDRYYKNSDWSEEDHGRVSSRNW